MKKRKLQIIIESDVLPEGSFFEEVNVTGEVIACAVEQGYTKDLEKMHAYEEYLRSEGFKDSNLEQLVKNSRDEEERRRQLRNESEL